MARRKPTVTARRQDGHHGARVAICREYVPGDFSTAVPVPGFRKCGGRDLYHLDEFCQWWIDQYAMAYPGDTFAYESPVNGRVVRSRMPVDFPAKPLPDTCAEYEEEWRRRELAKFDVDAPEYRRSPEERELFAEYERVMERLREVMGEEVS